jgi:hypothetical protein
MMTMTVVDLWEVVEQRAERTICRDSRHFVGSAPQTVPHRQCMLNESTCAPCRLGLETILS